MNDGAIFPALLALMLSLGVPLDRVEECFKMLSTTAIPVEFADAIMLAHQIKNWLG